MSEIRKWCIFVLLLLLAVVTAARSGEASGGGGELHHVASSWSVTVKYPDDLEPGIDRPLRNWLEERVNATLADVVVFALNPGLDRQTWDMTVQCAVERPSRGVASVIVTIGTFPSHAAHPMAYLDVVNFDQSTGKEIRLDDMFALPEKALEIMAREAPARARQVAAARGGAGAPAPGDRDWFEDGFAPRRENYAALEITPGGVKVHFQLYQILPYVYGMLAVDMPLDLLEDAGPTMTLWGH